MDTRTAAGLAASADADADEHVAADAATSHAATLAARQAITRRRIERVRHLGWTALSCAADLGVVALLCSVGAVPWWVCGAFTASCAVLIGVSYVLLRSGFSERFRDPFISGYQLTVASVSMMLFAALAPRAAFHFYNVMLVLFAFGALRLNIRQTVVAGTIVSTAVGTVMWLHAGQPLGPQSHGEAAVAWLSHLTVLVRCLLVGLYGSSLRLRLRRRNEQLAESSARIEQLATHDELTGALNRRAVWALLEGELTPPLSGNARLCVALLDLDHFKLINDRFGHPVGDAVLKRFTEAVRGVLRDSDRLGRYGGEEFLVMLPGVEPEAAQRVVERLRSAVEATDWRDIAPDLHVTVSCGVAAWCSDETVPQLISRADQALYRAKAQGRNRVVVD